MIPQVHAGAMAHVEIYDRANHSSLPIYEHGGQLYAAGEPGHQYEVRIRNRRAERLLAVVSADGVNVVTGTTAAPRQAGYVIDRWGSVTIEGWRKSLDDVATFYFTPLLDSYAARTGRADDVGVIGVALFRERRPCCKHRHDRLAAPNEPTPSASPAPSGAAEKASSAGGYSNRRSEGPLGTGHGHYETSLAEYVEFERASKRPAETIVIYYDSHENLIARGILPATRKSRERLPHPFPNGFVPDP